MDYVLKFGKSAAGFLVGSLLFIILFFAMTTEAHAEDRVVRVGYTGVDSVSLNNDGSYSGYTVEYLDEIAKYTGWKYEYVYGTWAESVDKLAKGEIDLLSMVRYTEELEETFLFSELSMADDYTVLLAAVGSDIYYKDYEAFEGSRVGVVAGAVYEEAFIDYAKEQGFDYHIVHYATMDQANRALVEGEINLIATAGISNNSNFKVVDQFSLERTYFVTGKQNPALMEELDHAIQRVRIETPDLVGELTEKYYSVDNRITNLHLTRAEQEYIDSAGRINVKGFVGRRPLGYRDSREYVGILPDYMKLISEYSGLEFNFEITDNLSLEEHSARMAEENYTLLYVELPVEEYQFENGIIATEPLFESGLSYVKRIESSEKTENDDLIFALSSEMDYLEDMIYSENAHHQIRYYDSSADCMDALVKKDVDVTIQDEYIASYLLQKPRYADNLMEYEGRDIIEGLCLYASEEQEMLVQILNKTINYLSGELQTKAVSDSMITHSYVYGVGDFFYEYGKWIGFILALLAAIVILVFLLSKRISRLRAEEKEKEELREQIQLDELTGVYNRPSFFEKAREMIDRSGNDICIVRLNVCRFNIINELYGSDKGDYLLQLMGHDLKEMGSQMGFVVGRFTADHFYLCIRSQDFDAIGFPRRSAAGWLGMDINLTYGIYPIGEQKELPVSVMCDRADMANRSNNRSTGEYICYYSDEERQKALAEQEIENEMEKALEERQFCIYIQPKYDVEKTEIVGGEALVRWIHPEKGMIPPGQFIGLFERNGFIQKLDYYVWEETCRFLTELKKKGYPTYPISVNVSRIHFYSSELIDKLCELRSKYELDMSELELEITESICAEDPETFFDMCKELQEIGFKIAMDDFGSGYSSLNMLKEMPLDIIKMDLYFLSGMGNEEQMKKGSSILRSLIELVHELDLKVVVEGVETEEQTEFIRRIGNCTVQGYYFSKPVDSASYEAMLTY